MCMYAASVGFFMCEYVYINVFLCIFACVCLRLCVHICMIYIYTCLCVYVHNCVNVGVCSYKYDCVSLLYITIFMYQYI